MAPVIQSTDPVAGEILRIDRPEGTVAWVVVTDENDQESLEYMWTVSGLGEWGLAQPLSITNSSGSQVELLRDETLDGRSLSVRVTDSFGASAQQTWEIEVPETLP